MNFETNPSENFKYLDTTLFNVPPPEKTVETDVFWTSNPNILLNPNVVFELFPSDSMSLAAKCNALTRLILILCLIGFIATRKIYHLGMGGVAVGVIAGFYFIVSQKEKEEAEAESKEGFYVDNTVNPYIHRNLNESDLFDPPTIQNPFSNVMITDYTDNPQKKPAPPFLQDEREVQLIKETINSMNPTNPNISNKLFKGIGDELEFEQSLRQFNSNPSTTIPNDQTAFTNFLYGDMVSCKEGNKFACGRNLPRYTHY